MLSRRNNRYFKVGEITMGKKDINYYRGLQYSIRIIKQSDGGYFAKVDELKGCMTQGENLEETVKNIQEVMELWLQSAMEQGLEIPEPEKYSGKFVLRIPKTLHRKLVECAEKEKTSLNQYLIYLLSEQNSICLMRNEMKDSIVNSYQEVWDLASELTKIDPKLKKDKSIYGKYLGVPQQWQ
jgi:antitoxin HicB